MNEISKPAPDTGATYLTEKNVFFLKRMFKDETTYIKHMETLWSLRGLTLKACEVPSGKGGVVYDKENPLFKIAELTNEFIGALMNDSISFNFDGEKINHRHLQPWKIKEH